MNIVKDTLSLYKSVPFKEKLRIAGRVVLGCYSQIIKYTPQMAGMVLDFGCGHGVYLNLLKKNKKIQGGTGIDIDQEKIDVANSAALEGLSFQCQNLEELSGKFRGVVTSDVFYLIPFEKWNGIFRKISEKLEAEGELVIKTVLKKNNWKHLWGTLQEYLSVHILRITSRKDSGFVFLDSSEWKKFLDQQGFDVTGFYEFGWTPYNHALILCRKRN